MKKKLGPSMSVTDFKNGYWYAVELKKFATALGIGSVSKLRKDELERAIVTFLTTGKITKPTKRNLADRTGIRDFEIGLRCDLPVIAYTNNRETKSFLEAEARKIAPGLKRKSGARYRLNRWRENQFVAGIPITYGDLIAEYVRLNQSTTPFERIPQVCYINFLSDYLANEPGATHRQAIAAWKKLKTLEIPNDYKSWVKHNSKKR